MSKLVIKFSSNLETIRICLRYKDKIRNIARRHRISVNRTENIFFNYNDGSWSSVYSHINGIRSNNYIPEDYFCCHLEPILNPKYLCPIYEDKNNFDKLFEKNPFPKTICRIRSGLLYGSRYDRVAVEDVVNCLNRDKRYIIKPAVGSSGGRDVRQATVDSLVNFLSEQKKVKSGIDWIVQELIEQHSDLSELNESSINTLRVMSFVDLYGEVSILSSFLRIGRKGSFVDNSKGGGVIVGVDSFGILKNRGYDKDFCIYHKHPDTQVYFSGRRMPSYDVILENIKEWHNLIQEIRLISWDVAVGNDGKTYLLELNVINQGISSHQLDNGPLFGEETPEIVAGCGAPRLLFSKYFY